MNKAEQERTTKVEEAYKDLKEHLTEVMNEISSKFKGQINLSHEEFWCEEVGKSFTAIKDKNLVMNREEAFKFNELGENLVAMMKSRNRFNFTKSNNLKEFINNLTYGMQFQTGDH